MKLIIVDDEPLARERLRRLLAEQPGWTVAGEAGSGAQALALIASVQPDLVLLDIHMAGMDGLQVARQLAEMTAPPAIIFTTAFAEHALAAFDAAAVGYLLKPIRRDKLVEALARARRPTRAQLRAMAQATQQGAPDSGFISAHTREGQVRVPVGEVLYFLADQKYTSVRHLRGELVIDESLDSLEQRLGSGFLRIHRKALVQSRFIEKLERGFDLQHHVCLRDTNTRLPVSHRKLPEVRRLLAAKS
ncbi:MAG: LytR/AlgR family response regulator transcription factor [Nevskiales bacterium]